jgi:hypothetical protein
MRDAEQQMLGIIAYGYEMINRAESLRMGVLYTGANDQGSIAIRQPYGRYNDAQRPETATSPESDPVLSSHALSSTLVA